MFGRISHGWELVTQSWAVLKQDKELLLFPVMSGLACLVVLASFALPMFLMPDLAGQFLDDARQQGQGNAADRVLGYVMLFAFYLVNYFVIVFFNTALVSCALVRFNGGNPTVADGLGAAWRRLPQILAWALVAATVGMILRAIEQRVEFVGKIIVGLIGMAWSIITYLVVPVLAVERVGPFEALKRSTALIRQTWGESLSGNLSLGAINFLLALPAILVIVAAVALGAGAGNPWVMAVPIGVAVLYMIGLAIVMSALQQVFLAGVYLYAVNGKAPEGLSEDSLKLAFEPKKKK